VGKINVDYDVLNQKGSPAWYSDLFANLPTPGYKGRMFISTDTFAFYRDNGVGWDLVGGPGTGTITGAGVFGQVTFFSGTDTISGSTDLVWDNTNKRLGIGIASPTVTLDISGSVKATALIKSGGTSAQILLADGTTTPTSTFQAAITLTTTGTTGSSTLVAGVLNVPTYTFVSSVNAITLGTSGTDLTSTVANSTTTPTITLNVPTASATNRGALSSADWTTFNSKQATITLTTSGTSGAATLVGATLNVPNYTNVGTVTSVAALTLGTSGTDLSSSVANSTSTPVITLNVPTASATNRGALSSADWTTFNSKQATISVTAPVVLTGATISMPAATTSVNGYLTSTDWNTFNNKSNTNGTVTSVVALTIDTSGIDITSTAVTTTTTPVITLNVPTASATNRGALSSTDWTTFNSKQATISVTAPVVLTGATISMPAATTSVNGYLTSADWTTFNNKYNLPSLTSGSVLFSNGATIVQDNANFFWDDTNNRLGIGTNAPDSSLQVIGTIRWDNLSSSNGGTTARYSSFTNTGQSSFFGVDSSVGGFTGVAYSAFIYTDSKPIVFAPSAVARVIIDTSGRTSIGYTTNPSTYMLDVNGTGRFTAGTYLATTSSNVIIGGTTSDLIASSKFIAIGNTAFQYSGSTGTYLTIEPGAANGEVALKADARSGNYPPMTFYTSATLRLTIASTGAATFSSSVTATSGFFNGFAINGTPSSLGTAQNFVEFKNTGGDFYIGQEGSVAGNFFTGSSAYASVFYSATAQEFIIGGTRRLQIASTGAATFSADATINSLTIGKGNNSLSNNTAFGVNALLSVTTGNFNIAVGESALRLNTTGQYNVAIGSEALINNTIGTDNTAVGNALNSNTSGSNNTAIGSGALAINTTGSFNTAIGGAAMNQPATGSNKTAVGYQALGYATGSNNIGIGYQSGFNISTGTYNHIFGQNVQLTTGSFNTMLGYMSSSAITTGSYNTIIGNANALGDVSNNIALADGQGNVKYHWDGTNTLLGQSGKVLIGATTYAAIGVSFDPTGGSIFTYSGTGSFTMIEFKNNNGTIGSITGNGSVTTYNVTSDYRLKQDFKQYNGLDLISNIKTYDFEWKTDKRRMYGVIAHELQDIIPYAVQGKKDELDLDGNEKMQSVDYSKIVPVLIKAIQELNEKLIRNNIN